MEQAGDVVVEQADGGLDTVVAGVGHYLHAHIQQQPLGATAKDTFGVGNALPNQIGGYAGANLLMGGDGDGEDGRAV